MKLYIISLLTIFSLVSCDTSDTGIGEEDSLAEETPQEEDTEEEPTYDYIVAEDGSGDFTTVQDAFDAIQYNSTERIDVYVKNGTYKEVITLDQNKNNVSLIGESAEGVLLTYDNYNGKDNPKTGETYGTTNSASFFIYGENFYAYNITFENSAGTVGQALAISIRGDYGGDKAVFNNCRFLGNQDTLFGSEGRQYFVNCYIEGTTDFIFGSSTAFFDNCDLYTKGGSAITAASTEEYVDYGYVFNSCQISGTGNDITTLGRPWRPYATVAFINTEMSASIKPAGWDNWGDEENETTARYSEYISTGAGAYPDQRVDWMKFLIDEEVESYTLTNVLKTTYSESPVVDNWNPLETIELYDH
ncbi:pectinesterase family protein [Galbibacter sp. EGI 63066]|uniref:pectinesterase family protein n=1 Tax=Galbibacter sp. EGI 63066 TaxID=2993559 RepID=UPI002248FEC9|nr:pectinesterase family protein [Galbibacter sp. EGI 63066]MCX2680002.1 pectinesterase family protein [Galbibacter sp. EGI 63066]